MPNLSLYESLKLNQFVEQLDQTPAQEYWFKAIATLGQFLAESNLPKLDPKLGNSGIFLTNSPQVLANNFYGDLGVQVWVFTASQTSLFPATFPSFSAIDIVNLDQANFDRKEWFLISINSQFSTLFISCEYKFLFSLHPEPVSHAIWELKHHISNQQQLKILDQKLQCLPLVVPTYKIMSKFALALLTQSFLQELPIPELKEVETIKAIAHEVKTPLTTIRTLVKSILRRQDVTPQIRHRLEKIDFECQDQIERFNLIFEIVKLDQQSVPTELTNLAEILQNSLELWQKQAQRRQLSLTIDMPRFTPLIMSNSQLLNQLLNSLVDRVIRSLPSDSHINIGINIVGKYVKVQFKSQTNLMEHTLTHKSVGQWLMLQPETGSLSLSLMISKVLFELIGGKLTIKTHPTVASYNGEILNIFLPIKE
jgi:signal transduction histidine kinase